MLNLEGRGFYSRSNYLIFRFMYFFHPNWALGSTQPPIEMSTRNLPEGKERWADE
jgi:hypothetical protein